MNDTILISAVVSFLVAVATGALVNVLTKEIEGWIDLLPVGLLRLARLRVPAAYQDELYEEWYAELAAALRDVESRPITRMFVAIKFAAGLLRSATRIADEVGPIREADQQPGAEEEHVAVLIQGDTFQPPPLFSPGQIIGTNLTAEERDELSQIDNARDRARYLLQLRILKKLPIITDMVQAARCQTVTSIITGISRS